VHVLHVESGANLYGGALQVLYLLKGLDKLGVRNTLFCPSGSAIAEASREFCTEIIAKPIAGELDPRFALELFKAARRLKPDIIHAHSRRGADIWSGVTARLLGIKAVVTRRVDNPERPLAASLKYAMYHKIITISEGIRRVMLEAGLEPEKIICVRSAIEPERYNFSHDRNWLNRTFGLDENAIPIGTIAQLIERKGHKALLKAAPDVLKAFPSVRFLFFGKGRLQTELEQLVATLGLEDKVVFAGFRNDLSRILPCLYMVVHPAMIEGLGVSLIEASLAGVPVIASDAGGMPEIVRHGQTGLLVPPGNSQELAKAIKLLISTPSMAKQMGEHAKKLALEEFNTEKMVGGNLSVYNQLLIFS